MIELNGKYAKNVKIFTDIVDATSISQVLNLANQEFAFGSKIRMMPDIHAGAGCTIGTTMTIENKVVPNFVGVDIGCGMETIVLKDKDIDFDLLDKTIREYIPTGFNIRNDSHKFARLTDLQDLRCIDKINSERAVKSIGTLGGGNHFIEVDTDGNNLFLIIHSGSRHLGVEIATYYQRVAYENLCKSRNVNIQELIETLKHEGKQKQIEEELKKAKANNKLSISKDMAYVEGQAFDDYIHDMKIAQHFAMLNRRAIAHTIIEKMGLHPIDEFTTVHNYIDMDSMILRKGAVSAKQGERLLIPINMRDGSIICRGKGNPDWNYSAPHGAGRLMSRSEAKETFSVENYAKEMNGIYTTSVCLGTLDECPMAYKPIEAIVDNIGDTVEIVSIIKPVYNFKASEKDA